MKKFYLLSVLLFGFFNVYSQTHITLTFHAKDSLTQNSLALDSVHVQNLTQNCDTTLYDSVSVLTLPAQWPVGIGETSPGNGSFILMQNEPNPFEGITMVPVYLKNSGELNLAVYDLRGNKLSQYSNEFAKGWHSFAVSLNEASLLVLMVSDNTSMKTIKLLSTGSGFNENRISYEGQSGNNLVTIKSNLDVNGFIFYLGNQLVYTSYVAGYHESVLFDTPISSEDYMFAMLPSSSPINPSVSTAPVTNITETTATSGGDVISDGGAFVTARGVCWSLSPDPTIAGNHTTDGSDTGSFVSIITGLTPYTQYYLRAYATNSVGTAYGNELTFTTITLPTVTTDTVTDITQNTATSGGNVTFDGGSAVIERGVCWSTSSNPTTVGSHTSDGSGMGAFTSYLTGLTANTLYHIRAYATNNAGIAYGNELTFTTLAATLPTVITTVVTNITQTTATSGGNVTSDGGSFVTVRGVCWSTSSNPTTSNSHTSDGSGMGAFTSYLTGLSPNTPYYVRAYATNSIGTAYGNQVTFTTLPVGIPTVSTADVTDITQTTATSGGNVTSDGGLSVTARGVCWNTSQNPTTAGNHTTDGSGTGIFVSYLTGLTPNTPYYVRAYATNSSGTAYGNQVSFTTLNVFTCGDSITINHDTSGGVAPVNKTVTYGTVTNIPGETSKCWITSNLGADHQATSKDDATEPSAGWYWQFNKKQGYKVTNNNTRTPNTPWIHPINENSDWTSTNDPCTLEMGNGWRIPTLTEWNNVTTSGGWTNWDGSWNSPLKMHAAGYLRINDALLTGRGQYGEYWSSTQASNTNGWDFFLCSAGDGTEGDSKPQGISLRCLKD